MANAIEASVPGASEGEGPTFRDGLGERFAVQGTGQGEPFELLCLRPELTSVSSFEFALRERAARLANFQHEAYARVRHIDRIAPGHPLAAATPGASREARLAIVSERVAGWRLADILAAGGAARLELDINAALSLIGQLVHGVAVLHQHVRGIAHGAIAPERIVVTAHARLVVVEHVLGSALERLDMTRERLWRDLRVAVPPTAGRPRFDHRADVTQIGAVALALVLGRPLSEDEYPNRIAELLAVATENRTLGGRQPLSKALRTWLARALQLDLRHSFPSAIEAETAFEMLFGDESPYVQAPVALETFLAHYKRSLVARKEELPNEPAERAAVAPVEHPPAVSVPAPVEPPRAAVAAAPQEPGKPAPVAAPVIPARSPQHASVPDAPAPSGSGNPRPDAYADLLRELQAEPALPGASGLHEEVAPVASPVTAEPGPRKAETPVLDERSFASLFGPSLGEPSVALNPAWHGRDEEVREEEEDEVCPRPEKRGVKRLLSRAALVLLGLGVIAATGFVSIRYFGSTEQRPTTGTLVVESRPPGLEVSVDGTPRGSTPLKIALAPGQHELHLETADGPRAIPVTMTAGGQVSQYIEAAAPPVTGRLQVTSQPAGAIVFVDGKERGRAPLVVADLAAGSHHIELSLDGASVEQEVTVEAGGTSALVVPVTQPRSGPVSGWLAISSPVELQVFEGGELMGTSQSERILMTEGRHEVELVNETLGYRSKQVVLVQGGRLVPLRVPMPDGVLNVNAVPWAEVWIDGQKVGETPLGNLALPLGPHEIVFRNPQFGEQRHAVTVTALAPARVSVDLRK
jgi:hypothetical protein